MADSEKKEVGYEPRGAIYFEGIMMPRLVEHNTVQLIKDGGFKFRDDDVILIAYPKSGSTWVQFILYLLYRPDEIDLDGNISEYIDSFVLFLEVTRPHKPPNWQLLDAVSEDDPRLMKTHLTFSMMGEAMKKAKTKSLLLSRNPKDMLVSYYHFYQMNGFLDNYQGTWDEFFELFRHNKMSFGDWFDYTVNWWESRKEHDLMHVIYDDLLREPKKGIREMADFLGKEVTDAQLDKIVEITSFDRQKENKMANLTHVPAFNFKKHSFFRKGNTGDWRNFFSKEQSDYVDKLYNERIKGTGMDFYFGEDC